MKKASIMVIGREGPRSAAVMARLEGAGYSLCRAATAEGAYRLACDAAPDVVLIDLSGTEGNPEEAAFEEVSGRLDIPAIYLVSEHNREFALARGPFGYITPDSGRRELEIVLEAVICRHETEKRLRESEEKSRAITAAFDEGVYILDEHGELTFMNPEAEHLLGWTESELLGKTFHDIVHAGNEEKTRLPFGECPVCRTLRTGNKQYSENEVFRRKDGTTMPVVLASTPVSKEGKIIASITAFRDISERRKMEEEMLTMKKLEAVGILAGGIAHDFNNMLTAIIGNISFARMFVAPGDKISDRLAAAERAALQAKDLTYQLLVFARGGEAERKTVSIGRLLSESAEFAASGSNIRCDIEVAGQLWPVDVDTSQMRQVILNLVTNAKEAMPGGGAINIRAENVTVEKGGPFPLAEGKYVMIVLKDQGPGIPREHLSRIFDPYFTTKEMGNQKGTGFGLAVCYSIIKNHGGLITVESDARTGTTFRIYLPASKKEVMAAVPRRPLPLTGKGRILLMDDEEIIRLVTANMLAHMGYSVSLAKNGEEAVELYGKGIKKGERFDAVILDLTVRGGMGGGETIERLRKMDPAVRAIVSSGYTRDPMMLNYDRYGFDGVLPKPYKIQDVSEVLQSVLGQDKTFSPPPDEHGKRL